MFKFYTLSVVACLLCFSTRAQYIILDSIGNVIVGYPNDKISFGSSCKYKMFAINGLKPNARFKGDIDNYLSRRIDKKKRSNIVGVVHLDIFVDTLGNACLKSLTNNTQNPDDDVIELNLDSIINGMPQWKPARRKKTGQVVAASRSLLLFFNQPTLDRPMFYTEYKSYEGIKFRTGKDTASRSKSKH